MILETINSSDVAGSDISTSKSVVSKINAVVDSINVRGGGIPIRAAAPDLTVLTDDGDTMQWIDSGTDELKASWNKLGVITTIVVGTF